MYVCGNILQKKYTQISKNIHIPVLVYILLFDALSTRITYFVAKHI